MSLKLLKLSDCAVFFDFDNTITTFDVLDDIIERFAVDKAWVKLEGRWKKGEIGSKECLEGQLKSVRVTKQSLVKYLDQIKIDPFTGKLFAMLRDNGVKPIILSDSFSFIIKHILKGHKIDGVEVYANTLKFKGNRLIPDFPYLNPVRSRAPKVLAESLARTFNGVNGCCRCAHCKKGQFPLFNKGKKVIVYVGDGHSDICPAQAADFVFAKNPLLTYLEKRNKPCRAFKNFKDIYEDLQELKR